MTAVLLLDQAGLPAGSSGFARTDGLITGALVTVQSVGIATTHEARILTLDERDTTSLGSFTQISQDPPTWTFSPTAGVDGMIRIELVTDRGLASEDRQVRVFGIRDANGLLFPSYGLLSDPLANHPDLADAQKLLEFIQANELNEPTTLFPNGNPFGYQAELDKILRGGATGGAPTPSDTAFFYSDDFAEGLRAAAADGPNRIAVALGGTVTTPGGAFAPQLGGGWGWANLFVPNAGGATARIELRNDIILPRTGVLLVFRARIVLPAVFADATPSIGMADTGDFSYARLFIDGGGFWNTSVQSSNGGAANDTVRTAAAPGKEYNVRIELTSAVSASFFVQRVGFAEEALGTESTVNTIPDGVDNMGLFAEMVRQAGLGTLSVDWWDVSGSR